MTETTIRPPRGTTAPSASRTLVIRASAVAAAADALIMVVVGEFIPPVAIFALLTVGALVLARRRPAAGVVTLGALALLINLLSAPFLISDLSNPTDPIAFVYGLLSGGGRVVALIAVILGRRQREGAARPLAIISVAILAVGLAGSVTARALVSSDALTAGDVEVVVAEFAFPEEIAVPVGGTLFLANEDRIRHTFTVEGTDLDVALEPGVQRRHAVDLGPGRHAVTCTVPGHESMTATLEVR